MSGISFNSSTVNTNAYVADANKNYTKDRAVNLDNTSLTTLKKDLAGAVETAGTSKTNQIFLSHTVNGKTITEKIDLNDPKNKQAVEDLLGQIKEGFTLSSLKFTPAASLKSSSNLSTSATNVTVTNNERAATRDANDGKDPQFKSLSENSENFISYDEKTGAIKGFSVVTDKSTLDSNTGKYSTKLEPTPEGVGATQMQDLIKNDFTRYNKSIIDKFPKEADGSISDATVDKFVKALQGLPGNSGNTSVTPENARELLSYVHNGQNTSGKVKVDELQGLLKSMTGKTGDNISGANNLKLDGRYGFATTLQVRSLSAMLDTPTLLKGNPVILMDTSGSMSGEMKDLSRTVGQIIDPNNTYKIGRFGDTGNGGSDMEWVSSKAGVISEGVKVNTTDANTTKTLLGDMSTKYGAKAKGGTESSIRAGYLALRDANLPKAATQENILLFTDEGDKGKSDFDNLIKLASAKNYKPIVVYHNDKTNMYYAIDLTTLKADLAAKGTSIDKMGGSGPNNSDTYEIDWSKVVSTLNTPAKPDIKSLSL
ncbi:MAG: hypothetical protein U0457_20700 [Candidatus Sericytochromatia bacterium]